MRDGCRAERSRKGWLDQKPPLRKRSGAVNLLLSFFRSANQHSHEIGGQGGCVRAVKIDQNHHPGTLLGGKHDKGARSLLTATVPDIGEPGRSAGAQEFCNWNRGNPR